MVEPPPAKRDAMQTYARQAKDHELIEHATEIRLRAERRLGEMMAEQPKATGAEGFKGNQHTGRKRVEGGFSDNPPSDPPPITLAQAGIDKNLAHRARQAAALTEEQFEHKVAEAKRAASTAIDRAAAVARYWPLLWTGKAFPLLSPTT